MRVFVLGKHLDEVEVQDGSDKFLNSLTVMVPDSSHPFFFLSPHLLVNYWYFLGLWLLRVTLQDGKQCIVNL